MSSFGRVEIWCLIGCLGGRRWGMKTVKSREHTFLFPYTWEDCDPLHILYFIHLLSFSLGNFYAKASLFSLVKSRSYKWLSSPLLPPQPLSNPKVFQCCCSYTRSRPWFCGSFGEMNRSILFTNPKSTVWAINQSDRSRQDARVLHCQLQDSWMEEQSNPE